MIGVRGVGAINAISCPSLSLCVAVDDIGDVMVSSQPTGGVRSWSIVAQNFGQFAGVSCPSPSFCAAVDT